MALSFESRSAREVVIDGNDLPSDQHHVGRLNRSQHRQGRPKKQKKNALQHSRCLGSELHARQQREKRTARNHHHRLGKEMETHYGLDLGSAALVGFDGCHQRTDTFELDFHDIAGLQVLLPFATRT